MKCKHCGKDLEETWKVCPECGKLVGKKKFYKKWWFWIMAVLAAFIVISIFSPDIKEETKEEKTAEKVKEPEQKEIEVTDFSKEDFENLIEVQEERLEELGLKKAEGDSGYRGLDGAIQVSCAEGKVTSIVISGSSEKAPSFHGISLGMQEEEAYQKAVDAYPERVEAEDGNLFINLESKRSLNLKAVDGKIETVSYEVLPDEQVEEYKKAKEEALRAEYIFPDSSAKYLSEDEVRSVEVGNLYIGRNEIFARHGYIFGDANLQQHFEATSWYQGSVAADQFNSDAVFNEFEKKNVELIKRIEDEINGPSQEELEKQAAIDDAYNFIAGKRFHMTDSQMALEFTTGGEAIAIGYYGSDPLMNKYCTYSISARYENYKDDKYAYIVYITIEGVEYYMRYFNNGSIDLTGDGEFEGWYDPL